MLPSNSATICNLARCHTRLNPSMHLHTRHAAALLAAAAVLLLWGGAHPARASAYDPHSPEFSLTWSEGWYMRVTVNRLSGAERENGPGSFGLVVGYQPRSHKGLASSFLGLLVQGYSASVGPESLQVLRDLGQNLNVTSPPGQLITGDPDPASPPNFRIESDSLRMEFDGEKCSVTAAVGDALLQMECAGTGQPYGPGGESPEGARPHLPCNKIIAARAC